MTYLELVDRLCRSGIEEARWEARLLIERFCGIPVGAFLDETADLPDEEALEAAVCRRCEREPLQYVLGEWSFYNQTYKVSPACLIPRSDTEILVEEAIKRLPTGARFADLCTGSGCIAVSVLAERPDTHAIAADLSLDALEIAAENAVRNGVAARVEFLQADVLGDWDSLRAALPTVDAILSNPPYIRTEVIRTLSPEVLREPRMALDGGADGLIFYRALLEQASGWLSRDGVCLFEIGYDQGEDIKRLGEEYGFFCVVRWDFGGCDRVAILKRKSIE